MSEPKAAALEVDKLLPASPAKPAKEAASFTLPEPLRKLWHNSLYRTIAAVAFLILTWYTLSTSLSLYNKRLLGKEHGIFGQEAFPAPLLMSAIQFVLQWGLATGVVRSGYVERKQQAPMEWGEWAKIVLSNGVTTGLDIGFSNKSFAYISMSFYTMCKSTTPLFLLLFAFLLRLERPSWRLGGVVAIITAGLLLLVKGEMAHAKFNLTGFCLVMTASCLAGFRFTITQVFLHGTSEHHTTGSPIEVMQVLTPIMAASVGLLSVAWEDLFTKLPQSPYFSSFHHLLATLLIIGFGAVMAFLMVWAEFKLIQQTSALTFIVAGTLKEVVTVIAAIIVLGETFTATSALGLVVVIAGVLLFNLIKYQKLVSGEIKAAGLGPPARASSPGDPESPAAESPTARLLAQHQAIQQLPGGIPVLSSGVLRHHR